MYPPLGALTGTRIGGDGSYQPPGPSYTLQGLGKSQKPLCRTGHVRVQKLSFSVFPGGPEGFSEVRGAGRNHFRLSWYLIVPGITSYDPKTLSTQDTDSKKGFTKGLLFVFQTSIPTPVIIIMVSTHVPTCFYFVCIP